MGNIHDPTVRAFNHTWGTPWKAQPGAGRQQQRVFESYFSLMPWDELRTAEGFDLGCGSGRLAELTAPLVGKLHCIEPTPNGIAAARATLADRTNVEFHQASVDDIPLADGSQDFGYSMGVLHHIPDTEAGLKRCVGKLKPGAPFLLYLYYRFDNRPAWFRGVWKMSDWGRRLICRLPMRARKASCDAIGVTVYWPLSRAARLLERAGANVEGIPLSIYRDLALAELKVASFDRFATPLEHRFTRREIEAMMRRSGLERIVFQETEPFWIALGRRAAP